MTPETKAKIEARDIEYVYYNAKNDEFYIINELEQSAFAQSEIGKLIIIDIFNITNTVYLGEL
jgi:hypothetical protein